MNIDFAYEDVIPMNAAGGDFVNGEHEGSQGGSSGNVRDIFPMQLAIDDDCLSTKKSLDTGLDLLYGKLQQPSSSCSTSTRKLKKSGSTSAAVASTSDDSTMDITGNNSFPRFCDISGQCYSVFDDTSSRGAGYYFDDTQQEDLLSGIELDDTSLRRVSSARDLLEGSQRQQQRVGGEENGHEQQPNLIETSIGHHRQRQGLIHLQQPYQSAADATFFAPGNYSNDYDDDGWQPKREVARSLSAGSPTSYHRFDYPEHNMVDESTKYRVTTVSDPFEERINKVLGPTSLHGPSSSLSRRRDEWASYQRHSEPADIGSPRRKKRPSIRSFGLPIVSPIAPPERKKLKADYSFSSIEETSTANFDFVENVKEHDVLLGRGPLVYSHQGNVKFHDEKKKLQPSYLSAQNSEKKTISQQLVDVIQGKGGSFLKFDFKTKRWHRVDNETARAKAAQALREDYTKEDRRMKREKYKRSKQRSAAKSSSSLTTRSHTF